MLTIPQGSVSDPSKLSKTGGVVTGPTTVNVNSASSALTIIQNGAGEGIEIIGLNNNTSVFIGINGQTNNPYLAVKQSESGYSMIDANGTTTDACNLVLATAGVERMRVSKNGNVLIGKNTDNASGKLQVQGDASFVGNVAVTGVIREKHGTDIASAASINLNTATGNHLTITGTADISTVVLADGEMRRVRFAGVMDLINGPNLVLQGLADITTAIGDHAFFFGDTDNVVRCVYFRTDGSSVGSVGGAGLLSFDNRGDSRVINGPVDSTLNIDSLGSFIWLEGSTEIDDDETCFATATGRWVMLASHPDYEYSRRYNDLSTVNDDIAATNALLTTLTNRFIQGSHTCTLTSVGSGTVATYTVNVPGAKVNAVVTVNFPPAFAASATYSYISGAIVTEGVLTVSITVLSNKGGPLSSTNIPGYLHLIVNP